MKRCAGRIGLAVLLIGSTLVTGSVHAATPASGSLSTTSPSLAYVGGPFVAANVTGAAEDTPVCSAATPCGAVRSSCPRTHQTS